eukprot:TRINITY_DN2264_c0_g3_i1.p1 TRINITY_DN2264_c0_g3~~TRINITY_DN2264_c0_g3_i1.p1  ORF type:complete len:120 (+),score=64.46 TRINITY_DN2264_c0_g3_i1:77-436(+)
MTRKLFLVVVLLLGLQAFAADVEEQESDEYVEYLKYKPVRQAAWWALKKGASNSYVRNYAYNQAKNAAYNAITSPFRGSDEDQAEADVAAEEAPAPSPARRWFSFGSDPNIGYDEETTF